MELIRVIRDKITAEEFEFSQHAVYQSLLRGIAVREVREAIASGEVIEDYPQDRYGPSCLIFGFTASDRPIHIQCSHATGGSVKIITVRTGSEPLEGFQAEENG